MVTLETVLDVIPLMSLVVVLAYYTLTIRNQNRTRQAQLLMNLYETYRSQESRLQSLEIQSWTWKNMDDFWDKYGQDKNPEAWAKWEAKASFFNGVGILLRRKLIDIKLLDDLLTSSVNRHWNVLGMGQVLVDWRKRASMRRRESEWRHDPEYSWEDEAIAVGTAFHGFDYLYHQLSKYRAEHPIDYT